ncbi:MAG: hypothetical protein OXI22_12240 [Defluviicoccus sp.]|nr:hypothetical protein [Defluviicoccus sp.]MDE0384647.1 hypothetical protein [Defluviicoccus sp.]
MKFLPVLLLAALVLAACSRVLQPEDDSIRFERNSEFDGRELRFFLTLEDGSEASVSTSEDVIEAFRAPTPMPGHRAHAFTFLKVEGDDTSVSHALLSWDPDNPSDYLAFGWWTQFLDQHPPRLSFAETEQYAIVDGPELDHEVPRRWPVGGTAEYVGQAGGLYRYDFGSGWGEDEGGFVIEEYEGVLTLTADFADRSLKGCIGCVGDLDTRRAHFGVFLGEGLRDAQGLARDYEIHLATAIMREDGTFERDRVTVRHPERTVTRTEGGWAGTFSARQDTDGNPRLVAGFSDAGFTESDGSEGVLYGTFLGLSVPFRETGVSGPMPGDGG